MRVVIAIAVSVLAHLILAAGLWWYFTVTPSPVVLAQLDLSSVELSLADEDVAAAVPVASLPTESAPSAPKPLPPETTAPPPVRDETDPTLPTLAEPVAPQATSQVPELPELAQSVRHSLPKQEAAAAPKQAKIDAPPKPKRAIRPEYPRGSRLRKEEGDVVLEIHVAASGEVSEVRVAVGSGFAELDEAAVRAAMAARFTPAKSGRDAVASVARLKLTFKLK